jgi:hypothetical protein
MSDRLTRRAPIEPATADAATLSVGLVWSTGAAVARRDARGPYVERLSLDPAAVDLSRLIGGPVLDSHRTGGLDDVLGTVTDAIVDGVRGFATVRISERHRAIFDDIRAGIVRQVSVGYTVAEWRDETDPASGARVRTAIRWAPHELSFVPIGADAGAVTRGHGDTMDAHDTTAAPAENRAQINAEIRSIGRLAGLSRDWCDALVDRAATADEARAAAFDELARRPEIRTVRAEVGTSYDDPQTRAAVIGEALYARNEPAHKPSEAARAYSGYSTLDVARDCLARSGASVTGLSASTVIARALHSTSDFPLILGDSVGRTLRAAYDAAPRGVLSLARQRTAKDFRARSRVQLGEAPELLKVNEAGEFKSGTMAEARESYKVETFGRIVSLSRQALVNDDLGAFADLTRHLGRAAAEFEDQFLVDLLTGNSGNGPTMADGKAMFHADHGNKATTGGGITDATLTHARLAMRTQKGLSGRPINVVPTTLLVTAGFETTAQKAVSAIQAAKTSDVNPFTSLRVVVDPRLDAKSATRWYLVADPATFDGLEYSYLESAPGPQVETKVGFEVDGVQVRIRLDFGGGVVDWRGWYMSPGA